MVQKSAIILVVVVVHWNFTYNEGMMVEPCTTASRRKIERQTRLDSINLQILVVVVYTHAIPRSATQSQQYTESYQAIGNRADFSSTTGSGYGDDVSKSTNSQLPEM